MPLPAGLTETLPTPRLVLARDRGRDPAGRSGREHRRRQRPDGPAAAAARERAALPAHPRERTHRDRPGRTRRAVPAGQRRAGAVARPDRRGARRAPLPRRHPPGRPRGRRRAGRCAAAGRDPEVPAGEALPAQRRLVGLGPVDRHAHPRDGRRPVLLRQPDRGHQRGTHRARPARTARAVRPADRPRQPHPAARPARPGRPPAPGRRADRRGGVLRPRPLQAGQRLAGARGRRRAAPRGREPDVRRPATRRHPGPHRRRRVRHRSRLGALAGGGHRAAHRRQGRPSSGRPPSTARS